VNDSFAKGGIVYMHLTGPMGKHLLHAAQMQPGLEQPPNTNAGKLQLVDALVALIDSNKLSQVMLSAKPECMDTDQQVLFAQKISADPLPIGPGDWQGDVAAAYQAPKSTLSHRHVTGRRNGCTCRNRVQNPMDIIMVVSQMKNRGGCRAPR